MKKLLLVSSCAVIVLLAVAMTNEIARPAWKGYQKQYAAALHARAAATGKKAVDYPIQLRQIVLPELNRTDRCVSCHVAMEDPGMKGQPNPLAPHPGKFLDDHDVERYGCTICHDGQGRAVNARDAHAAGIPFWERPRLEGALAQANCARCHRADMPESATAYRRGEQVFVSNGCMGCHVVRGKGGHLGPELTNIGNASFYEKAPSKKNRHRLLAKFHGNVNLAYLYESVKEPKAQPKDSAMVDYKFSDQDADAVTIYLKSLRDDAVPEAYVARPKPRRQGSADTPLLAGRRLYLLYCSACHGKTGEGTDLRELDKVGPALGNPQFLSIVTKPFVRYVVRNSQSRIMPAWGQDGGLNGQEIDAIAEFVLSLRKPAPSLAEVDAVAGQPRYGRALFEGNCSACHGIAGEFEADLVGPTLNTPELLSYIDRQFLYDMLVNGRPNTAMPAWHFLDKTQIADTMAYVLSLRGPTATVEAVLKRLPQASSQFGESLYRSNCAPCHGLDAQGGIGPSLSSPEFQTLADDEFLATTVVKGRQGTAMPSWAHLRHTELAAILAWVRTHSKNKPKTLDKRARVVGSEFRGREVFDSVCSQCHGAKGQGKIGPAILGRSFLTAASDAFIKETVAYGRTGTQMRGNLRGADGTTDLDELAVNGVVAYIRSFETRPAPSRGVAAVEGDVQLGRERFARACAQCHGAYGGGGNGPAIGRRGFLSRVSDGFIQGMITNGRSGTEMRGFAPGGDGVAKLGEHETSSIVAYLRSQQDAPLMKPKVVRGTPLNGAALYARQCAQCHGTDAKEGYAPRLLSQTFLHAATDSYLQATLALGRHESGMRPMTRGGQGVVELESRDVNDIVAYLRSFQSRARK